jgi:hypothetical protein
MVINTSVSAASLQSKPLSAPKPAVRPAASESAAAPATTAVSPGQEALAAFSPEITTPDAAQQSTDFASNSILNQSTLALISHGQLQSQTVMDLLAQ